MTDHDWQPCNGREVWCHLCGASCTTDELRRQVEDPHHTDDACSGTEAAS